MKKNHIGDFYSLLLPDLKRIYKIMKLTSICMLFCISSLLADNLYSQTARIDIHTDNAQTKEVIDLIEAQTDYLFVYNNNLDLSRKVSLDMSNVPVAEILARIFTDSDIVYAMEGNNILLLKKKESLINQQDAMLISGTIVDSSGEPIIGANVMVKGTTNGVISDIDGRFGIQAEPTSILVVSYIGYHTLEIPVNRQTVLSIVLTEDSQALEEIIVVGYGTQKKVNLTGAVSSVSVGDMTKRQVGQTSMALQGLVPGVAVTQRSGQPGADHGNISIRGKTTIGNNDALILVDGVETSLNNLDPSLIESISILKDAASSSIYGSRAANGVILITTKRAAQEQFSVSYSGYVGWQQATDLPNKVNAIDHMLMTNQAYTNIGKSPLYSDEYINEYRQHMRSNPDQYPDTDWYDESLTNNGLIQNHFVTLSGGSKRIRTLASVGYLDQNGIIENSNFKRYTFRMNTDMEISKQFSARVDAYATMTKRTEPSRDDAFHWMSRIPANQAGVLSTGQWGEGWNGDNPIAFTNDGGLRKVDSPSAILNFELTYKPTDWLTVKGSYSPNYWETHNTNFNKMVQTYKYDGTPYYRSPQKSTLKDQTDRNLRNLLTGTITFDKTFGSHGLKVLAGYQQEDFRNDGHRGERENFAFPDYPVLDAGGEENQKAYGWAYEWALQSIFGRINYDYQGKYLFEASMRYDGSSRFAKGNRWGVFPSFSVGWRISEEAFWDSARDIVDNLKIRASWGQLGNQNTMRPNSWGGFDPDYYPFSSDVNLGTKYIFDKTVYSGAAITDMANNNITWETTTDMNIGLDATFFGKLNITADYFQRKTKDILLKLDVPLIIGMKAPSQNAGEIENKGWELGLTYTDKVGDFNYRATFNLSDVKNKVIDLKGVNETGLTVNREGYPMNSIYALEAIGYIQPEDYDSDGNYMGATQYGNFGPGDIKYKDQNGDGEINSSDRVVVGGTIPRYTFGVSLYGEYKGVDLSILLQGVGKANGYIYGQGIQTFIMGGTVQEQHKDSWTPENRNAKFPRLAFNESNNEQNSSFWMKNAAYMRLKNLQVGYSLSNKMLEKTPFTNLRFYFSGDNLLTFDKFWDGFDVEAPVGNGGYYPQMKSFSFGVDVRF